MLKKLCSHCKKLGSLIFDLMTMMQLSDMLFLNVFNVGCCMLEAVAVWSISLNEFEVSK